MDYYTRPGVIILNQGKESNDAPRSQINLNFLVDQLLHFQRPIAWSFVLLSIWGPNPPTLTMGDVQASIQWDGVAQPFSFGYEIDLLRPVNRPHVP